MLPGLHSNAKHSNNNFNNNETSSFEWCFKIIMNRRNNVLCNFSGFSLLLLVVVLVYNAGSTTATNWQDSLLSIVNFFNATRQDLLFGRVLVYCLVLFVFSYFLVTSTFFQNNNKQQQQQHKYEKYLQQEQALRCPNPNCIRCQKYTAINNSAQRRLRWVIVNILQNYNNSNHSNNNNNNNNTQNIQEKQQQQQQQQENQIERQLERITNAVQLGPTLDKQDIVSNTVLTKNNGNIKKKEENQVSTAPIVGQYPTVFLVRGLTAKPIVTDLHQDAYNYFVQSSANYCNTIWDEYLQLQSQQQQQQQQAEWTTNDVATGTNTKWNVLHFMNQGIWNDTNCRLCPKTCRIIKSIPNLLQDCIFANVFVSVLEPGTNISPHCGPTNIRHRLHFVLHVPTVSSRPPILSVLEEQITWKTPGDCIVFDDSLIHSVQYPATVTDNNNDTKKDPTTTRFRIVLIVDLWHSELQDIEREAIRQLYPPLRS